MATIIEETSIEAVKKAHANACTVDELEGAWDKDGNKITLDETAIREAQVILDNESVSNKYQTDRLYTYPPLAEQLDLLYKDIVAGTVTTSGGFATQIKATKDKYPKPS